MKKITSLLFVAMLLFSATACSDSANHTSAAASDTTQAPSLQRTADESEENQPDTNSTGTKILIAYFSRADENYSVGVVEKGNTEIIAELIADETGGDLFHIERDTPYPADYDACTDEAKTEQDNNARPALQEEIDISDYDLIFLGYPIWWGDLPMPVYTFLEAHDFSGKTVVPFSTHAGSGLSSTESRIENVTDAEMLADFTIAGTTAQNDQSQALQEVQAWLELLGL